jgi:hypothetical protein
VAHLTFVASTLSFHDGLLELFVAFFLFPLLIYLEWVPVRLAIPVLVVAAVVAAWGAALSGATTDDMGLGQFPGSDTARCLAVGMGIWLVAQCGAAVWQRMQGLVVFAFARQRPRFFATLTCAYALSVCAQEFLFRSFFYWRYQHLAAPATLFAINVLAFGWVHIIFRSWISVAATAVGGILFAGLYQQFHSLVGVSLVHLAFGLSIFAMGWGRFFLTASVHVARQAAKVDESIPTAL